jgi:hypothetical protein
VKAWNVVQCVRYVYAKQLEAPEIFESIDLMQCNDSGSQCTAQRTKGPAGRTSQGRQDTGRDRGIPGVSKAFEATSVGEDADQRVQTFYARELHVKAREIDFMYPAADTITTQ